jgi:hypothetical protein
MDKMREEGQHACREENGQTIYMEDMIMEHALGRKLKDDETVFHHGNYPLTACRPEGNFSTKSEQLSSSHRKIIKIQIASQLGGSE